MFLIAPWLAWIAAVASGVLLVALWSEFGPVARVVAASCFVLGIYGQFFSQSSIAGTAGLALQTALAIYLIVRWRLSQINSR